MKNLAKIVPIVVALVLVLTAIPAMAAVSPENVFDTMDPGQSITVTKTVDVPPYLPMIDVYMLTNVTGSFIPFIDTFKGLAPDVWDAMTATGANFRMGLGSLRDWPMHSWGSPGDWPYQRETDLTFDKGTFVTAVNNLVAGGGADIEESQYTALYQAVTGAGKTYDGYTIPAGQQASFRPAAFKVFILVVDSPFHNPGDPPVPPGYPDPGHAVTVAALNGAGITVIGLNAGSPQPQLQAVCDETGGVVHPISASGDDIVEAIMDAIGALTFDVTPHLIDCAPLVVTFDPAQHNDVPAGSAVTFQETIAVPEGTPEGNYCCHVEFRADGIPIGTQQICIGVPADQRMTVVEVLSGTSSSPMVKCKWETPDDGDPDHVTLLTQTLPVLGNPDGTEGLKTIRYWAVCTDPEGVGTVANVYADVYHPAGPPLFETWKYQLELAQVEKVAVGLPAFENAWSKGLVWWNHDLYPDADAAYADIMYELTESLAEVYMGQRELSSHQPHGDYRVDVQAVDDTNVYSDVLSNCLTFVGITAAAFDFNVVNYGTVTICTEKWIGGDWDMTTPNKPTVRNIGNTQLRVTVHEDDMGLGMTDTVWNVHWDARLGVAGTDVYFDPMETVSLPEILTQCTAEKLDFSIHVEKAPAGKYTGKMDLGTEYAPY